LGSEGVDATAPCGFKNACFHFQCLEKLRRVQGNNFRCPHCNVLILNKSAKYRGFNNHNNNNHNKYNYNNEESDNNDNDNDDDGGGGGGGDDVNAIEKIIILLNTWLLTEEDVGGWVQKPVFVRMQYGMQRGEKEIKVLRCVVARLVRKLKDAIQPLGGVRILTSSSSSSSSQSSSSSSSRKGSGFPPLYQKTFICRNILNTFEYTIVLRRVAFIESMGRVSCDGYSISGKKVKILGLAAKTSQKI